MSEGILNVNLWLSQQGGPGGANTGDPRTSSHTGGRSYHHFTYTKMKEDQS
jgi:hypothetical protein